MNAPRLNTKPGMIPLWFIVLFSTLLVFTISSASVYVFNKTQDNPKFELKQSRLESRKHLMLLQSDVIDTHLLRTLNPLMKKVTGRLIWSSTMQQGIIQFTNLPKLDKEQNYHFWIYDLDRKDNKPVSALKFNKIPDPDFMMLFNAETRINTPFKFELVLEKDSVEGVQPLLLAQP